MSSFYGKKKMRRWRSNSRKKNFYFTKKYEVPIRRQKSCRKLFIFQQSFIYDTVGFMFKMSKAEMM